MPQSVRLFLSEDGRHVLGRRILKVAVRTKPLEGTLLSYEAEGIWFQDARLLQDSQMILVKWNFIDAIVSDIPPLEPAASRRIGFEAAEFNRME